MPKEKQALSKIDSLLKLGNRLTFQGEGITRTFTDEKRV